MSRILVVDDESAARYGVRRLLEGARHAVLEADSGERALELLAQRPVDAILLDYQMQGMDGLATLDAIRSRPDAPPVVLFTAQGSEKIAVEAMRRGAQDYLVKPADRDELLMTLERAIAFVATAAENERLRHEVEEIRPSGEILGNSAAIDDVRRQIALMAPASSTVLVLGESGTGKELVARQLHQSSGRPGPFVAINCGALPQGLIEGELFGHERGAFTGAASARTGRIRQADGGTLFLDEIGDMPLEAQVRLLRVIEERAVEPLGGSTAIPVDIRVVAATHRDLRAMVAAGTFREDLFYRLEVLTLSIPPLRERRDDALLLARALLRRLAPNRRIDFSPAAERAIVAYRWPGNVRELRNVVERASVLCRGESIGPEHLALRAAVPADASTPTTPATPPPAVPGANPFPAGVSTADSALSAAEGAAPAPSSPAPGQSPAPLSSAPGLTAGDSPRGNPSSCDSLDGVSVGHLRLPPVPLSLSFREAKAQVVDAFERAFVLHHFERLGRNVSQTAQVLDMHRQSLQQKLRDLGLARQGEGEE